MKTLPITFVRAAMPYLNTLDASLAAQAGGGEQIAWRPEFGGADPLVWDPAGYWTLWAQRMTAADHAGVAKFGAKLKTAVATLATAAQAKWKACWLESNEALSGDYSVSWQFLPGAGVSHWGGVWTYASDAAHRDTRAEIDIAEVTNNADGSMRVRQQMHGIDPVTKQWSTWPAGGHVITLPRRQIITAGYRIKGDTLTFTLNGADTCTIGIPDGLNVPQHLIASNMVGGIAKASDASTPSVYMNVWPPVVTQ